MAERTSRRNAPSTPAATSKKAPVKTSAATSTGKKAPTKKAPTKVAADEATPAAKAPTKKATAKKAAPNRTAAAAKDTKAATAKTTAKAPAKTAAKAPAKKAAPAASTAKKAATKSTASSTPAKKAAPAKSPFDAKFLESQHALLLEERARLLKDADTLTAEAYDLAQGRDPGDVQFDEESGEGDTLQVERERDLALSAQFRLQVEEIDRALLKFDAGTYGICEVSGDPIPKERLKAIPWARERVEYKVGGFGRR
jgi:RNA polymerase-binding transcription factor DksA